jgi:hypothetical protein
MSSFSRWPAVVILAGLVAAAWIIDQDHEREQPEPVEAATPLEAQGYLPVAPPEDALSSTWYCAGGTAEADGRADTSIIVANATDAELAGSITIFPNIPEQIIPQGDAPVIVEDPSDDETTTTTTSTTTTTTTEPDRAQLPVTVDLTVPAQDETTVRLADEIDAEYAAALVELPGGAVSVEQRVDGPSGADVSPCTTQASPNWYFAEGRTTAEAVETLAFFNPFPDAAVVDVTFRTESDLRSPVGFTGYTVPGQTLVVEDIGTEGIASRHEHVSVSVEARSGRLVVNRLMDLDGSEDVDGSPSPQGLEVTAGAPVPADVWYFPDGIVAEGVDETYVVYNPGEVTAEVDLYIEPNEERFGEIEPFSLSIPPGGYQELSVEEEERIGTAIADAEGDPVMPHGARVVSVSSVNGEPVPVVVERVTAGSEDSARPGFDATFGAPLLMEQAVLAASSTDQAVIVDNPSGTSPVRVTFRSLDGGTLGEASTATDLEVPIAGRLVVDLDDLGLGSEVPLLIEADGPVTIERRLVIGDPQDTSSAIAVPLAGTVSLPDEQFG